LAKNKKKLHDEQVRRGLEELQREGVTLDDTSPSLISDLMGRFGHGRPMDLAIIFVLGRMNDPAAVEALTRVDKEIANKDLKKEIRRSLFKLAQKGLVIPESPSAEPKPVPPILKATEGTEAYMSAVDGGGGRLLWIVKPQPGRGLQLIQAMVNDRQGLQRITSAQIRRKALRQMSQEMKTKHGVSMVSVPWEYADRMLVEGYEQAKGRGQSGVEDFHELRTLIATGKPKLEEHPIYQRLKRADARKGAWREQSQRLLDEPELRYWILDEDWMQAFLSQLEEAQTSRLVLNAMQKEERMAGIVRDAVKSLCEGEAGRVMQRRVEDMTLYFLETQRPEQARLCLAIALQVGEGDPGPLDVSFLTGLVQKSFAFLLSQEKAKKEEEASSLIIKP
jgi:hypothetical protein